MQQEEVLMGRIVRWDAARYFGFIQPDRGPNWFFNGRDYFGDPSDIQVGMKVRFEAGEHRGRACAVAVEVLSDDAE
jgi:cold shock CspA family protein